MAPAVKVALAAQVALAAVLLGAAPLLAQSLNFGGGSDLPIEINAEQGIEWQQENLVFLARGKAVAKRGQMRVHADILRAYYREKEGGGTDIWRLDAEGNVRITSPGETATGEKAVYNLDNSTLVLKGGRRGVRLKTRQETITASKQLEYWEKKQMAVARGNAQLVRGDRKIRADVLAAYFHKDKSGKTEIHRVEAFGNVRIDTAKERAYAERGVYNVQSGIATLVGSVKIQRAGNQLTGCSAEINLNTGISRLFGCKGRAGGKKRVQGLILPGRKLQK